MRYIIIEDERLAYEALKRLMERLRPDYKLAGRAYDVREGARLLKEKNVDFLLSDIRLSDGTCFDLFDQVDTDLPVIFTTAYNNFAAEAFRQNGIDYLLKPIGEADLGAALVKLEQRLVATSGSEVFERLGNQYWERNFRQQFLVRDGSGFAYIRAADVACFYLRDGYTKLRHATMGGKTLSRSVGQVEKMLDPRRFFRISRTAIVNRDFIRGIRVDDGHTENPLYRVVLHDGVTADDDLRIGLRRLEAFKDWLGGKL